MLFTSSTQQNNTYIDKYLTDSNGIVAFIESGYGNVGVQNSGSYGQKTFCFSYALSRLVDAAPPSTKNNLLQKILDFFEVPYEAVIPKDPYIDKTYASASIDSVLFRTRFSNFYNQQFTAHLIYANLDSTQIDSLTLYDDGMHGDSLSNDGLYGAYIPPTQTEDFYSLSLSTINHQNNYYINLSDVWRFTTVPLLIDSLQTGTASNFRYTFKPYLKNAGTSKTITNITVKLFCNDSWATTIFPAFRICPNLAPGQTAGIQPFAVTYDSASFPGYFNLKFEIMSNGYFYWTDTLRFYDP